MAVLITKHAPAWLVEYARFTLFGRACRPKIKGFLLNRIFLQVGVDMGSAISPFLFCLALDPLIRHLNTINSVAKVRCYMDDNATALHNINALARTQHIFDQYKPAGLIVKQHKCCAFHIKNIANSQGGASWERAAKDALRTHRRVHTFYVHDTDGLVVLTLHRTQIKALYRHRARILLNKLVALPCKCGCKTALLPIRRLTFGQLVAIDRTPWGAKPITDNATALGLPLYSPHKQVLPHLPAWRRNPNAEYNATPVDKANQRARRGAEITAKAHAKNALKIAQRGGRIKETITPLYQRVTYFTLYQQSTTFYACSVHPPNATQINFKKKELQNTLFDRKWINKIHSQAVLRIAGISGGATLQASGNAAFIGLQLRRYGTNFLLDGLAQSPRQTQTLALLGKERKSPEQLDLSTLISQLHCPQTKKIIKILEWYKKAIQYKEETDAYDFLLTRMEHQMWNLIDTTLHFKLLGSINKTMIPSVCRTAVLRWWLNADTDEQFRWHEEGHSTREVCPCGCVIGTCHPLGVRNGALAREHIDLKLPCWYATISPTLYTPR